MESKINPAITEEKKILRKIISGKIAGISEETKKEYHNQLNKKLIELLEDKNFCAIAAFIPISDEPDIKEFLKNILHRGMPLILPKWLQNNSLAFYKVEDFINDIEKTGNNLWEPKKSCEEISLELIPAIIVPGVAFSEKKQRLGRGKGCYDRALGSHKNIYKIGIAYPEQIVKKLPVDALDIDMNEIVTCIKVN